MTSIWKSASLPDPCQLKLEENGWLLENGQYRIKWFDGEQIPKSMQEILNNDSASALSDAEEDDLRGDASDDEDIYDDID